MSATLTYSQCTHCNGIIFGLFGSTRQDCLIVLDVRLASGRWTLARLSHGYCTNMYMMNPRRHPNAQ